MLKLMAVVTAAAFCAIAMDDTCAEENDKDYRAPTGFGGYAWATPLGTIPRLTPDPIYVRIAHSSGVVTDFDLDCFMNGATNDNCSRIVGEGFHALAEYYVDGQGFRFVDTRGVKTVLYPITYQFCANWRGFSANPRGDVLTLLKLCGARLHFRSETAAKEREIADPDYQTAAQRVLAWLIRNHGAPEGYARHGNVYVGLDTRKRASREERFDNWFWCRPKGGEPTPSALCAASIAYSFDSETGQGQVIFLTPDVWMYAHARRFGGVEDDPLYRVLYGLSDRPPPVQHICTGTFLCKPSPPQPMPEKMLARFRLPAAPPQ